MKKYLKFKDGPKFGPCEKIRIENDKKIEAVIKGTPFTFPIKNGKVMIGKLCFDEAFIIME